MPKAVELLRQGRHEELWQMCCGYLNLDIDQFMAIQKRLLMGQINVLYNSPIGKKLFGPTKPASVEEFRERIPLTTYSAYCPELEQKREDVLPVKPGLWVHTSGKSGEYSCKWVPMSPNFIAELGPVIYGVGMLSACRKWGDTLPLIERPNIIYTVAPRPYVSGALASILQDQTPSNYFPSLAEAESLPFEDRIKQGFEEALVKGLDYFFGVSIVLSLVGNKMSQSANHMNIRPMLKHPGAMLRLTRGLIKSRLEGRTMLPKDLWQVKGIVTSGLDSCVYRDKIKEFWGRYPLDVYSNTEGGIIATQTWDYSGMTFIPNLNFLEFIPEKEHLKWQLDHEYQPKTILLDEVKAGENYEIVITNFHGGALVRYRIGDMIKITALRNDNLGIDIPQMMFERRADDLLDFSVIRLSERTIWKAIEKVGVPYEDWVAYKTPGKLILNVLIELTDGRVNLKELEKNLYEQIIKTDMDTFDTSAAHNYALDDVRFDVKVIQLPRGAFSRYTSLRRAEGADIAHLKPPHVNPPQKVLNMLTGHTAPVPQPSGPAREEPVPVSVA